jgi:thymidine phosphorylase
MAESQSFESAQRDLNPHRDEERQHATDIIESQLRQRGIRVTGDESSDDAADLLSAVERFESAVSALGGDRFVNDPRSRNPEDKDMVIPRRNDGERADAYTRRVLDAADRLGGMRKDD